MSKTLNQILIDANATLDLEATAPTGDELTLRSNYANQAVFDASAVAQFDEFKAEFLTAFAGSATVSLPSSFREFQVEPMGLDSSGNWVEYEIIQAEEKYDKNSADRYVYKLGNPQEGYVAVFNQALVSGSTLSIIYQRYPTGFPTLTSVCELPDPTYVTRKIESYVLYSRGDDRFPQAEAKEQQVLLNMVGREAKGPTGARKTKAGFTNPLK